MTEARRGRTHDAEGTREAILNAAEEVFAEHGFDGARIAVIAAVAHYNSSLIFQYFGDKLGLYTAVLRRSDEEMSSMQGQVLGPLLTDEASVSDPRQFKMLLTRTAEALFDYLVEHPRLMRMLLWEQADNWQVYSQLKGQFQDDSEPFNRVLHKAHSASLLRSDFAPLVQLTMILQICLSYLTFIPLYQMFLQPDEDFSSPDALARAREYIVNFVVAGMMADPEKNKAE